MLREWNIPDEHTGPDHHPYVSPTPSTRHRAGPRPFENRSKTMVWCPGAEARGIPRIELVFKSPTTATGKDCQAAYIRSIKQ